MSDIVKCHNNHVFNVESQRCITDSSSVGKVISSIETKMGNGGNGMVYFTRGCPDGHIKNPSTGFCLDSKSGLGKTIYINVEGRHNGINNLRCMEPLIFNEDSGHCVAPYNNMTNMQSCSSFQLVEQRYSFMPHEEQIAVSKWFINESTNRGIVLFHSLGSGKTCTSIIMIDMWLESHPRGKVFIYLPAALRQNFMNEYCTKCGIDESYLEDKFIFISYNYVANQRAHFPTHDVLNGNLIVIDEFHKIILGMINEGVHYPAVYNSINNANPDKIICLTGTALTQSPLEIYYTVELCSYINPFGSNINYVENHIKLVNDMFVPVNNEEFKNILGSVYSRLKPIITAKGANGYPIVYSSFQYVTMNTDQYVIYVHRKEVESRLRFARPKINDPDYENKRRKYYLGVSMLLSRQICNMFYTTELGAALTSYAPKFAMIVDDVAKNVGKHVIYSQFKTNYGVFFLENTLIEKGFSCLDFTGDNNDPQRANILAKFNAPSNMNGNKVKCLLITAAGNMGLNLFAVRTLHIVEQSINPADKAQAKGRVVRYGGHNMLPPEDRDVRIIQYMSISPGENISNDTNVIDVPKNRWTSDIEAYLVAQRKEYSVSYLLEILDSLPLIPTNQNLQNVEI